MPDINMIGLQRVKMVWVIMLAFDPLESLVARNNCDVCISANGISTQLEAEKAFSCVD